MCPPPGAPLPDEARDAIFGLTRDTRNQGDRLPIHQSDAVRDLRSTMRMGRHAMARCSQTSGMVLIFQIDHSLTDIASVTGAEV